MPPTDIATTERALKWLNNLTDSSSTGARQNPFFLAVGYTKPHMPFVAPQRFFDLYPTDSSEWLAPVLFKPPVGTARFLTKPVASGELVGNNYLDLRDKQAPPAELTQRKYDNVAFLGNHTVANLRRAYYACVSHVDHEIGRVLRRLEDLPARDSTVTVLLSDHGYSLGEHGWFAKHSTVPAATRAPLVFHVPGMRPFASDEYAELVDIFPTLVATALHTDPPRCPRASPTQPAYCVQGSNLLQNPAVHQKHAAFVQYAVARYPSYTSAIRDRGLPVINKVVSPQGRGRHVCFSRSCVMVYAVLTTIDASAYRYEEWVPFNEPSHPYQPDFTAPLHRHLFNLTHDPTGGVNMIAAAPAMLRHTLARILHACSATGCSTAELLQIQESADMLVPSATTPTPPATATSEAKDHYTDTTAGVPSDWSCAMLGLDAFGFPLRERCGVLRHQLSWHAGYTATDCAHACLRSRKCTAFALQRADDAGICMTYSGGWGSVESLSSDTFDLYPLTRECAGHEPACQRSNIATNDTIFLQEHFAAPRQGFLSGHTLGVVADTSATECAHVCVSNGMACAAFQWNSVNGKCGLKLAGGTDSTIMTSKLWHSQFAVYNQREGLTFAAAFGEGVIGTMQTGKMASPLPQNTRELCAAACLQAPACLSFQWRDAAGEEAAACVLRRLAWSRGSGKRSDIVVEPSWRRNFTTYNKLDCAKNKATTTTAAAAPTVAGVTADYGGQCPGLLQFDAPLLHTWGSSLDTMTSFVNAREVAFMTAAECGTECARRPVCSAFSFQSREPQPGTPPLCATVFWYPPVLSFLCGRFSSLPFLGK